MIVHRALNIAASLFPAILPSATCNDVHDCRTVPTIIYTCASTMFLCTWAALHLNVERDPWKPWWKRALRRVSWMVMTFLAPEYVLFRAFDQWTGGCRSLLVKLQQDPSCRWTETHAMLARMGGLRFVDDKGSRTIPKYLTDFPSGVEMPTKEEIQDKSKGDDIAKAITIIQTLWFAIQAAHRASQGLIVTELELTTLGHVVLNIFIYWCWWNKPLNVRLPIDVRLKNCQEPQGGPNEKAAEENMSHDVESHTTRRSLPIRVRIGAYLARYTANRHESVWALMGMNIIALVLGGLFGAVHCLAWNYVFPTPLQQQLWRISAAVITATPGIAFSMLLIAYFWDEDTFGPFIAMIDVISILPYCIARICLLVISIISLRTLPYKAYETPSWSIYLPHIS